MPKLAVDPQFDSSYSGFIVVQIVAYSPDFSPEFIFWRCLLIPATIIDKAATIVATKAITFVPFQLLMNLSSTSKKSVYDCTIKAAYPIRSDFSLKLRE